jgi:hypothetical protein
MRHVLPAILALAACGDPPLQEESRYFRLYHDDTRTPCRGTLPALDRYLEDLRAELGLPPPAPQEVEYHWVDEDLLQDRCARASSGCVQWPADRLYAVWFPHTHEVVHAAATPLGEAPSWLAEGLAMTYQGGDNDGIRIGRVDAHAIISGSRNLPAGQYIAAGAWVRHLLDRFGAPAVVRFYADLSRLAGEREVGDSFARIFGEPLPLVAAEFRERFDGCRLTGMTRNLWECGADPLEWDGDTLILHRTIDCAQDDVVGPYDGEVAVVFHTIDVDVPGLFDLRVDATHADDDVAAVTNGVALGSCASTCESSLHALVSPGDTELLTLPRGRYYLELHAPSAAATAVAVSLRRITAE